ncbi:type I-E CRISPR-associated protein Cse2/CasB [Candidatus Sumerlaeota bacterium]|nr:type I-E CRISPR-associated protein Cse2/CasB [Candidatus Sumerlaeota bacterium]
MTATEEYIQRLGTLKAGELGLLRTHAGQGLDESVEGFDLFAGLWWPLREKNQRAPRREVAWLIAKLYASCPAPHAPGDLLPLQLGRLHPLDDRERARYRQRFDRMLLLPLGKLERPLQWGIDHVRSSKRKLDWVKLTDDLSYWEHESKRLEWAKQFLEGTKGNSNVD